MEVKMMKRPSIEEIEKEFERINIRDRKRQELKNTLGFMIVVAAIAVLIATLYLPVFSVEGDSMEPIINSGDIVVGVKYSTVKVGDIIAFNSNNKTLVKRVIAQEGDYVDVLDNGDVYVNDKLLDEPYLSEKNLGKYANVEFPYQVPVNSVFVMGDSRESSLDSRSNLVGAISKDNIIGKIIFRIYPLQKNKIYS